MILQTKDSVILKYTYTNHKGFYQITYSDNKGKYILSSRSLSYVDSDSEITIVETKKLYQKNFSLNWAKNQIEEVIIRNEKGPITIKKDTISIRVKDYLRGNEEVAEDILKNLPGIDVSENGSIRAQGKNIVKVLVDGDDLFEKGYKILTKNLDSDLIYSIEILQNFSNNPLLKGVEETDLVALNIVLKENRKSTLFGKVDIGLGNKKFTENKLNLISFQNKTKFYFFGNINNTGENPTRDIIELLEPERFSETDIVNNFGESKHTSKLINLDYTAPLIERNLYDFNNSKFASLNMITNPNKKLKIKGLATILGNESNFFRNSIHNYEFNEVSFTNFENDQLRKNELNYLMRWEVIYTISNISSLHYINTLNTIDESINNKIAFNNMKLNQSLSNSVFNYNHKLTYTNKIDENEVFMLNAIYTQEKIPQNYTTDSVLLNELLNEIEPSKIQRLNQDIKNEYNFFGAEIRYIKNNLNNNIEIKSGYSYQEELLRTNAFYTLSGDSIFEGPSDYQNNLTLRYQDLFSKIKYSHKLGSFKLKFFLEAHKMYSKSNNPNLSVEGIPVYLVPRFALENQFDAKNKLVLLYEYNIDSKKLDDLYDGFIIDSYKTSSRGTNSFSLFKTNRVLLNYTHGNWIDSFLANANIIYDYKNNFIANDSKIEPNFSQTKNIILNNASILAGFLSTDIFFDIIKTNVKLKGSILNENTKNILNGIPQNIEYSSIGFGAQMRSAFKGDFGYHIGTQWYISNVKATESRKNSFNTSFIDINYNFSEEINLSLSNDVYFFKNQGTTGGSLIYSNLETRYTLKKNKITFKFEARNLFNSKTFSNTLINNQSEVINNYEILPRYFMLKCMYRF